MSRDLAAWLDGRWVDAYPYTPWEMFLHLIVAWRAPLGLAAAAAAVVVASIVAASIQTRAAADRARRAAAAADFRAGQLLADRSLDALSRGDGAQATLAAASALALIPSSTARGVLAAAPPPPHRLARTRPGECARAVVVTENGLPLCVSGGPGGVGGSGGASLRSLGSRRGGGGLRRVVRRA